MVVYYKGQFIDSAEAVTDTSDPHFRYGAGFFETILYNGKEIQHLDRHVARLEASCAHFGFEPAWADYRSIISVLIEQNALNGEQARVNICQTANSTESCGVFISAVPYTPPKLDKVFRLCLYPHVHESYMSEHKSMNYMHFMMAKKYAQQKDCDDSILTDSKGNLLETSTASMIIEKDGQYYTSKETNRLKSISLELFAEENGLQQVDIKLEDIQDRNIFITNSLMGLRKAVLVR
ncbi:MAG: aminotransferase class IV [Deferribacterales bacterium]